MFHKCRNKEEIKKLYHQLANRMHPDKGGNDAMMILLNEAASIAENMLQARGHVREDPSPKPSDIPRNKKQPFKQPGAGEYSEVSRSVDVNDPEYDMVEAVHEWLHSQSKYKSDFIDSVYDKSQEYGFITQAQYNAMLKSYIKFKVHNYQGAKR